MIKRVEQTKFGAPEGNCYQACLAMLLGYDSPEALPVFEATAQSTAIEQIEHFNRWLAAEHGLAILSLWMPAVGGGVAPEVVGGGAYILHGMADRGLSHAVVVDENGTMHDPHPSQTGIRTVYGVDVLTPCVAGRCEGC